VKLSHLSIPAESDGYSFTSSSLSRRSSSAHKLRSRPVSGEPVSFSRPQTASPDRPVKPSLIKSLFPNIPPVVQFVAEGEKGTHLLMCIINQDFKKKCFISLLVKLKMIWKVFFFLVQHVILVYIFFINLRILEVSYIGVKGITEILLLLLS